MNSRKGRLGRLLLILGVVLALVVLTVDLTVPQSSAVVSSDHGGHGEEAVAPAHSPIAIVFIMLGTAAVSAGLVLSDSESLRSAKSVGLVAGLTLLYADGLLHWLAVLEHLGEPLPAAFFIVAGGAQVGAVPLVRNRERILWWIGVALTLFFIELYIITRIVPPPFSLEAKSVESLGTLSKGIEFALLAALGLFFGPRMVPMGLRSALVHKRSLALLFLGVLASLITNDIEAYSYWWVLSMTAFIVASFLLIGLVSYAALAHYLRVGLLVGLTWSFVMMVVVLHGIYALDYARAALAFPLFLCVVSGGLLSASMVAYRG